MADARITGKIFTEHPLSPEEEKRFVEELTEYAVSNGIWVNTYRNMKNMDARFKYPPADYCSMGFIPFEITDGENADEANEILGNLYYISCDGMSRIINTDRSGLPRVQSFMERLIQSKTVKHVILDFSISHGYPPHHYGEFEISAHELCEKLMTLPVEQQTPSAQFTIKKR